MIAYVCNDIVPLLMCISIQFKLAVKNLWSLLHIMSGKANRRGSSFEPSWPNSITVGRIASFRDRIGSTGKDGANGATSRKRLGYVKASNLARLQHRKKRISLENVLIGVIKLCHKGPSFRICRGWKMDSCHRIEQLQG